MPHHCNDSAATGSRAWFKIEQSADNIFHVVFTQEALNLLRFHQAHIIRYIGTDKIDLIAIEGVIADALFAAENDRRLEK